MNSKGISWAILQLRLKEFRTFQIQALYQFATYVHGVICSRNSLVSQGRWECVFGSTLSCHDSLYHAPLVSITVLPFNPGHLHQPLLQRVVAEQPHQGARPAGHAALPADQPLCPLLGAHTQRQALTEYSAYARDQGSQTLQYSSQDLPPAR